jgi:hypothetical protein
MSLDGLALYTDPHTNPFPCLDTAALYAFLRDVFPLYSCQVVACFPDRLVLNMLDACCELVLKQDRFNVHFNGQLLVMTPAAFMHHKPLEMILPHRIDVQAVYDYCWQQYGPVAMCGVIGDRLMLSFVHTASRAQAAAFGLPTQVLLGNKTVLREVVQESMGGNFGSCDEDSMSVCSDSSSDEEILSPTDISYESVASGSCWENSASACTDSSGYEDADNGSCWEDSASACTGSSDYEDADSDSCWEYSASACTDSATIGSSQDSGEGSGLVSATSSGSYDDDGCSLSTHSSDCRSIDSETYESKSFSSDDCDSGDSCDVTEEDSRCMDSDSSS